MVRTVLGDMNAEQLGVFHAHEHIFLAEGPYTKQNPALCIDDFEKSCQELRRFCAAGGATLTDAQPVGCGRMADALMQAAALTGVNIVASTGFHKLSNYDRSHWMFSLNEDELAALFMDEITVGMYVGADQSRPADRIAARAGVIKTAIDRDRMADPDKRWFAAAAHVSCETGAPLLCHTESVDQGLYLAEWYLRAGVQPDNIILCHLDRTLSDIERHRTIASLGVYLEYDTIGRFKYHDDQGEADLIRQMWEWGYGDSILLGLDTTRERLASYGGAIGLDYLEATFVPLLRVDGVSTEAIDTMLVRNPSRAFSLKGGKPHVIA